jgi:hypothetical protein
MLQSTLDFIMHVLVVSLSICSKEEVPLALEQMHQAGAQITTSESMLFQLQGVYFMPPSVRVTSRLSIASSIHHQGPTPFTNVIKAEKGVMMLSPVRDRLAPEHFIVPLLHYKSRLF